MILKFLIIMNIGNKLLNVKTVLHVISVCIQAGAELGQAQLPTGIW